LKGRRLCASPPGEAEGSHQSHLRYTAGPRTIAIAARADYEHAAIMRGDDMTGMFGQFQPAAWR
jgi:hypothetical protein